MEKLNCHIGLAFIVEGPTEKVFYLEYLQHLCAKLGVPIEENNKSQEDAYLINGRESTILVMFNTVNSVSQITNSATWYNRACCATFPDIRWTVFLCYDTDDYQGEITKFYEGDWRVLRETISPSAANIIDLAAKADIEDVILSDYSSVLDYLGLPAGTVMPDGNKGKTKLKKLYRMVAINNAYHSGERAHPLIQALDMDTIKRTAPINLGAIDKAIENC